MNGARLRLGLLFVGVCDVGKCSRKIINMAWVRDLEEVVTSSADIPETGTVYPNFLEMSCKHQDSESLGNCIRTHAFTM